MKKTFSILTLSAVALMSLAACTTHQDGTKCCSGTNHQQQNMDQTPAYFAFDSSVLSMADKDNLDQIAQRLMKNPNEKIRISGYADMTGTPTYNKELSERRAESAAKYLEWKGISADRISTHGYGATNFADKNSTKAGRAKNRRIEVEFY